MTDAEMLARLLGMESQEAREMVANGDLFIAERVLETKPEGFRVQELEGGKALYFSRRAWLRLFNYGHQLFQIREMRAKGMGFETIRRALLSRSPEKQRRLIAQTLGHSVGGVGLAKLPWFGSYIDVPAALVEERYAALICWLVGEAITAETDVVIEIGAALGDISVALAQSHQDKPLAKFIATDFSRYGAECAKELGEVAGLKNFAAREFDAGRPEKGFLRGASSPLFFFSSVFRFDVDIAPFLTMAVNALPRFRMLAFEPITTELPLALPDYVPLEFLEMPDSAVACKTPVLRTILEFAENGRIRIERLVPDIIAKSPYYPLSLIEFSKA